MPVEGLFTAVPLAGFFTVELVAGFFTAEEVEGAAFAGALWTTGALVAFLVGAVAVWLQASDAAAKAAARFKIIRMV